jgi:uncharacterized membrane protein YhiD involved in acid resistance
VLCPARFVALSSIALFERLALNNYFGRVGCALQQVQERRREKPKQNKTKQNKTKQNKTKQNKTKQSKAKQNKTKQNKNKNKNICLGIHFVASNDVKV